MWLHGSAMEDEQFQTSGAVTVASLSAAASPDLASSAFMPRELQPDYESTQSNARKRSRN